MDASIARKLQRQKEFFDSPCGGKTKVLYQFLFTETDETLIRPQLLPENKQLRIDWAKRKYAHDVEIARVLDDDSIPCLPVASSTGIFPEAFGAKMFYPQNDVPCAIHFLSDPEEARKLTIPKLEDSTLMYLFDIADELAQFGGPDAILQLPDIQDPFGIAGIMWDKSEMLLTLLDDPDCMLELTDKIYTLLTTFLDEWFRRYGSRFAAHYPQYVLEQGISVSADEVGLVSPEMFREFIAPNLNRLSDRYGGIGIHCCALSEHQFENFSQIHGLKLMNLYRPGDSRKKAYDIFRDVCAQCHGDYITGIPTYIGIEPEGMVPEGAKVIYREKVTSLEDALRKQEHYASLFR